MSFSAGYKWMTLFMVILPVMACSQGIESDDTVTDVADASAPPPDPGPDGDDSGTGDVTEDPAGDIQPDTPVPVSTNYIIVADDSLVDAAEQIAQYRSSTGFEVALYSVSELLPDPVTVYDLPAKVRDVLSAAQNDLAEEAPLYLLLVGDAREDFSDLQGKIPAIPCQNLIGDCVTDNAYADLDGDKVPDAAVGRIPASTTIQVTDYLDKLKGHENDYEVGLWNRRISVYTGEANFSIEIDTLIEMAVMEGLTRVSHAFDITGGYDNPSSSYYYDPFKEKVIDLFNQGNIMVIYIGHGSSEWTQGLDADQVPLVHCKHRLPIATFFACHAGNYAGSKDCLAEQLLWKADGPIVTYASSDVSHPYGNAVLVYEIQRAVLDHRPSTAGLAFQDSKAQAIYNQDEFRDFIDAAALIEVAEYEQPLIRSQHLDLYNLLGDPAAAVKYPASEAQFEPPVGSVDSGSVHVTGNAPGIEEGTAFITLEMERNVILWDLEPVDFENPDQATIQSNWEKANNKVIQSAEVAVNGGTFQALLEFTDDLPVDTYWLKVYAHDDTLDSFGFIEAP